jgi:hypothetical protein
MYVRHKNKLPWAVVTQKRRRKNMRFMEERILKDGQVRPGDILKVDSFLNHQLDVAFLDEAGKAFYEHFEGHGINKILTVEASGIALSCMAAQYFRVSVLFAKKAKSRNLDNDLYTAGMNVLDGQDFYGAFATHVPTGTKICYEASQLYKFWCIWNDRGVNGYFCPEPCTWMINAPNLDMPKNRTGYFEIRPNEVYECWEHIFVK